MNNKLNPKEEFSKTYKKNLINIINSVSDREIADFVDTLLKSREQESVVYFIGNGGSASTASHFANDISIGTREHIKPFRAISLCDNQAITTAIANVKLEKEEKTFDATSNNKKKKTKKFRCHLMKHLVK